MLSANMDQTVRFVNVHQVSLVIQLQRDVSQSELALTVMPIVQTLPPVSMVVVRINVTRPVVQIWSVKLRTAKQIASVRTNLNLFRTKHVMDAFVTPLAALAILSVMVEFVTTTNVR